MKENIISKFFETASKLYMFRNPFSSFLLVRDIEILQLFNFSLFNRQ